MKSAHVKFLVASFAVIVCVILVIWIVIPLARERSECVSLGRQWKALLKEHPDFSASSTGYPLEVEFHYADSTDENLTRLRRLYDLESVAGQGSEVERIINLMSWVYQLAGHANEPVIPAERNAFTLIHMAQVEQQQINCYMKTVILNEVYLAMGFASRHTHLLPYANEDQESHFITSVYARSLGKWVLMDPDFGVYVTDEKGELLGVREVRRRFIAGEPLRTVQPGRSSLTNTWSAVQNFVEGADYPWFLSCFIFKMRCPKESMFNQYSMPIREYYELIPDGYREELLQESRLTDRGKQIYTINDEDLLWQEPTGAG